MELTQHQADAFARMPLTYLRQEYPNHIMHLLNDDGDVLPPRELHPVFYGCFDWHSAASSSPSSMRFASSISSSALSSGPSAVTATRNSHAAP